MSEEKETDIDRIFPTEEVYQGFIIPKIKPKHIKKIKDIAKKIAEKVQTKKGKKTVDISSAELLDIAFDEVEAIIVEICGVSAETFEDTDLETIIEVIEKIIKKNEGVIDRFFAAQRSWTAIVNKATSGK